MFLIRTGLSEKGRNVLIEFCRNNLRHDLDPEIYANTLEEHKDLNQHYVVFEIGRIYSRNGHTVTIGFDRDDDFITEELEN